MQIKKGIDIEQKSFAIIDKELGDTGLKEEEHVVLRRVIHATGDFEFARNIRFHPLAIAAGMDAVGEPNPSTMGLSSI